MTSLFDVVRINRTTHLIIGAGMRVHRRVGPGVLESAYQLCFAWELKQPGLLFVAQHPVPLVYGDVRLDRCYRLDFLVEDLVVVEIKAVDRLLPVHRAQMLTYLRLTGRPVGLVLNFCAPLMKDGIMRVANGVPEEDVADYLAQTNANLEVCDTLNARTPQSGRSRLLCVSASLRLLVPAFLCALGSLYPPSLTASSPGSIGCSR